MNTIDDESIGASVTKVLLSEGTLTDGVERVDESLTINAGKFRIDSLAFIRAFIAMEDEFGIEFGDEVLMQHEFSTFGEVIAFVTAEIRKRATA